MRRVSSLFVVGLALSALPKCDCGEGLESEPAPEIEVRDPVTGNTNDDPIKTDDGNAPLVLAFGAAEVGQRPERAVEVINRGDLLLNIKSISFAPAAPDDEICPVPSAAIRFRSATEQAPGTVDRGGTKRDITIMFEAAAGSHCRILLIETDDVDEPVVKVYFTASGEGAKLCAEPDNGGIIDFGTARPMTTKRVSQTIKSCGSRPVQITDISIAEQLNDVFSIEAPAMPPSGELPPCTGSNDAECSFTIDLAFTPDQGGLFSATLNVSTATAGGTALYPFQLQGRGAECNLVITPTTVNFGAVAANGTATQTVLLRNSGVCHCQVDAITDITPDTAGFSFVSPPATPFVLRGTEGCDGDPEPAMDAVSTATIQVRYEPGDRQTASTDNASFHVQSASNTQNPDVTVNLQATGGGTPRCEISVDPVLPPTATSNNPFNLLPEGQDTYKRYGLVRFGNVTKQIKKRMPIALTNTGNTTCNVSGLAWDRASTPSNHFGLEDAGGNAIFVGGNPNLSIAAGDTLVVHATYTPQAAGEKWVGAKELMLTQRFLVCGGSNPFLPTQCEGNGITFTTDAQNIDTTDIGGGPGVISIGFNAASVAPAIDVIPTEVDFGLVTLGCGSEEREVKIYNTGSANLLVASTSITPSAMPVEFRVTASPAPPTATVAPGGSIRVKVRFYPRHVGAHTANLVITTDEGNGSYGEYTVPLRGEGTTESHVVDVFRQISEPQVDVLWVVDDSGSMSEEQAALGANFPLFFSQTSINNVDYHIAVTTTLLTDAACIPDFSNPTAPCDFEPHEMAGWYTSCPGNDKWITRTTANPAQQFACNVSVADHNNVSPNRPASDSAEAGLQAAKIFLSEPNISDPNINGGFLREDAKLYVIIVSDEEDQSEGPTDLYVDFFQNLKGYRNRSLVSVSAIAGRVPGGCSAAEQGARYQDTITAMGNGLFQDICATDWGNQLENLAFDSFGLKTQFFLTRNADPAQLQVCVGDQDFEQNPGAPCTPVAPRPEGSADGYFYEADSNSIVFNAGSVPDRGKFIKVEYEAACFPLSP